MGSVEAKKRIVNNLQLLYHVFIPHTLVEKLTPDELQKIIDSCYRASMRKRNRSGPIQ